MNQLDKMNQTEKMIKKFNRNHNRNRSKKFKAKQKFNGTKMSENLNIPFKFGRN